MAFEKVGNCATCGRPMWTDGQIDPETNAPRVLISCQCEKIKKDKLLAPIVIPERDKDLRVRDCVKSPEGHVVVPLNFPLPEPADPAKRDMVYELTPCIKCEANIILQLLHNNKKVPGLTIMKSDGSFHEYEAA